MQKSNRSRTIIQIMCTLSLFLLFAICSLILITISASNYKGLLGDADDNFNANSSLRYVTNKLHAYDTENGIHIETINNIQCLSLKKGSDNELYKTLIYYYDGYLYELYASTDFVFSPGKGEKLMKLNDFKFNISENNTITLNARTLNDKEVTTIVHLRCAQPKEVKPNA